MATYDELLQENAPFLNELKSKYGEVSAQPSASNAPSTPGQDNSLFRDFGNAVVSSTAAMGSMLPAVVGWTSDALGYKPGKDWSVQQLKNIGEFQKDFPVSVPSYTGINDLESAAHYTAGLAGNLLPSVLGGVGAYYAGGAIGKHLGMQAAEGMIPAAAQEVLKKYVTRGALTGATASSIGMEAGQIAQGQAERNNDLSAMHGVPLSIISGLTEVLPFVDMFKRTGQWNKVLSKMFGVGEDVAEGLSRAPGFSALMGSIAKQGVRQMPAEKAQEGAQAFLERAGVPGESLWDAKAREDYINNILGGGLGGLAFGGMAGAGARVRQNQQPSGARLADIFRTDVGGPPAETGLVAPPEPELTYLGRREHPPVAPPGLPAPSNMLPEPVDSMGNRIPYTGSVPPAPELDPNKRTWFPYGSEGDETAYPTSSAAQQVDLTQSPAQPPATGTTTPSAPVDLTSPRPQSVVTPAIAKTIDETSRISGLLDETTMLDTQVHPTTGDLVVLDPDQSLAGVMQPRGALFNETYRSWVVPQSKINDIVPELQAAAPLPDTTLANQSLEQAASNATGQPIQFGDVVERLGKTRTPKKTSSELGPLETAINAAKAAQPEETPTGTTEPAKKANQDRMNAMLEASGLGQGRLAAKKKGTGSTEGAVEPRTGITMLDGRYDKALGAGDVTKTGETVQAAPYSNEIRQRQNMSWMAESEEMNPAAGESARSIQKLAIYHPENNATGTPEKIIMSGSEGWRTSGKTPHAIDIDNHYDANYDFFKLWPKAQEIAAANPSAHPRTVFANLVRQQGYAGYVSDAESTGRERWAFSFTPVKATPALETAKVGVSPVIQGVSKVPQDSLTKLMALSDKKQGKMDKVVNETAKTYPEIQIGFRTSPTVYYGEQAENTAEHGVAINFDNITKRTLSAFASELGAKHDQNTVLIASPADRMAGAKSNSKNVSFSLSNHSLDEVSQVMQTLDAPFNIVRESDGSLTMEYLVPNGDKTTMQKFTRAAKIFAPDGKLNKENYYAEFIPKDQYHAKIQEYFGATEGQTRYDAAKEAGAKHTANVKSGRYAAGPEVAAHAPVQGDTQPAAGPQLTLHEQLTKVASEVSRKLPAKLKIQAIQSPTELPAHARAMMSKLSKDAVVYGYMDHTTNTCYLVSSSLQSVDEAYEILAHELIAHYSLSEMLGDTEFDKMLKQIYDSVVRDPALLKTMLELNKVYEFDRNTLEGRLSLAEELIAHVAETSQNPSWFQNIVSAVREWLRKMGLQVSWTDQDIRALLKKSSDWLFDGEGGKFALTNARGNFMAEEINVLDSGTAIIQTDKLSAKAPPVDINYLANGKLLPQAKDLPNDPSVQKLWAGVHSVVKSLMDPRRSYEGLNRSMVEDMLGNKPQLSGPASAAWTDLQNFYASVLGTSAEPKRVKVTTELTTEPERRARFALKNDDNSPLKDNDFWNNQLKPYWLNALHTVNSAGLEILPDIRKYQPTIMKRSDELRAVAQSIIDNKVKTMVPPGLDTVGTGQAMALARQSAVIYKEFKAAVDAWKDHMLGAISHYSWKPGKTTPQVTREGTTWMVNKKAMPVFDSMIENHRYVRNVKSSMNGLLKKIWEGASAKDQKFARMEVEKQLKALGATHGAWVPNMPGPVMKAMSELKDFYKILGWHQNPHPVKVEPKFAAKIKDMPFNENPQGRTDKSIPGRVYDEASDPKSTKNHNTWIRQSDAETNENRQLMIQFSTHLINKDATVDSASRYYDALYSGTRPGYTRLHDFWEIPQWMGFASHFLPNADVYVIQDMEEAKKFLAGAGYERIMSSAIDVNVPLIKELASTLNNVTFNVGGYTETGTFADIPNITWYDSMKTFADQNGFPYSEGTDYHHFTGSSVIPRLTMSQGCLHKCAFCTVPKNLEMTSDEVIDQQAMSFGDLDAGLVYLNDKTFGQAKNYKHLVNVRQSLRQTNPNFQGFIVQTTAASINKMSDEFLQESGIKYVELGVESYNDLILKDLHKPHNTTLIDKAVDKLRNNNIQVIPNIIIGLPAETAETYAATQAFLERNADVISHANIYNLAIYKGSELASKITSDDANDIDENVMTKSFHVDKQIHADFSESVFSFGQKQLERPSGKLMAKGGKIGKNEGNLVKQYLINKYQGQEMVGAKFLPMQKWNGPDSKYKVYTTFLNKPVTDEGSFQKVFADAQEWMKTSGQRPWTSQELMRYKEQIKKYVRDNNLEAEYKATKNRKDAFTFSENEKRPSAFSQTVPNKKDVIKRSPSAWRSESKPYAVTTVRDKGGSFLIRQGKPPDGPTMKAYKLFRTLKTRPGEIFPLFIGNKEALPVGEWLTAEPRPTAGYADRPGWHSGEKPGAPHLTEKNRVWAEIEIPSTPEEPVKGAPPSPNGQYRYKVPKAQGGEWILSGSMKVLRVLNAGEVKKARDGKLAARIPGQSAIRNDVNGQFTQPNDRWYSQPMTFTERLKEVMNAVKDWWHERVTPQLQHFKDLNYRDPSQLPMVEYLRQAEEIPRYARELVGRFNQRLLAILKNPQDRDTYEHLAVLRDMFREATIGVVSQKGPQQVADFLQAQGYANLGQLESHIAHFEALRNPAVNEALNLRKTFWDRWRQKAVAADILPDSILGNDDYFHHQVKAWQELNDKFSGTAPGMHKTKKSFQKGRTGYAGEYNLNYFSGETGVLVDLITQVQTAKSLQDIRNNDKLNVLPRLVAEADRLNAAAAPGAPKETWKTVLKSGLVLDAFGNPITEQTHEFYKPVRGNFFHKVLTLTERSIRKVMEELQNVVGPDPTLDELMDIARIHAGTAMAGGLRQPLIENYMVLNRQIIRAMEHFQEQTDPTFLGRMTSYIQTQWKRWILFNPFRVTRYLLNNTTGDADIAFAFRPGIFKHVGQAYKELHAWAYKDSAGLTNAQRNKLETLNRKGVLGSGITVQEIPELSDDTVTKLINDPKPQLIKRWFKGVHKFNNFRENIMRLAAWEYMNAEAAAGRFADLNYAASKKAEIDAIDSMDDKIVKMSRELIGDYGNLSYVGQKLRKYVIPFWSWTEINAPRYFKMMKNELRAGNTRGGLKIAGVMGAKAAVRAAAFAALVMAWNFTFFRDEEEEMRRLGRDQLHLILGRRSDGSVVSLRVQGSFSDTMGWLGAENLLEELRSIKKGRVTLKEESKAVAMAPVKRLIGGITPVYKTAAEVATGKSMFPEPFDTRPIRDKFQHVMKGAGLDWITDRFVSGKPAPPLFSMKTIATPFLYVTDTHEAAYFHAIKLANDWLKEQGMPRTSSEPTPRSNALYYWRQATKLKDKEAEAYYKALYLQLGGKEKGMQQSIKHTDPLVVIPLKLRAKFLSSMGEDNKKTWRMGVRWWQETFKGYPHAPGNSSDED